MTASTLTAPTIVERTLIEMLQPAAKELACYADSLANFMDNWASDVLTVERDGIAVIICFETSWDYDYEPATYDSPSEFDKLSQSVEITDIEIEAYDEDLQGYELGEDFKRDYMQILEDLTNNRL